MNCQKSPDFVWINLLKLQVFSICTWSWKFIPVPQTCCFCHWQGESELIFNTKLNKSQQSCAAQSRAAGVKMQKVSQPKLNKSQQSCTEQSCRSQNAEDVPALQWAPWSHPEPPTACPELSITPDFIWCHSLQGHLAPHQEMLRPSFQHIKDNKMCNCCCGKGSVELIWEKKKSLKVNTGSRALVWWQSQMCLRSRAEGCQSKSS